MFFFFFDWFRNVAVPVIINCGGPGGGGKAKGRVCFFLLLVPKYDRNKGMSFQGLDFAP